MSKKDAFFNRLDRGMTPDRAAELSDITSRKVKHKYVKEWHAIRAAEATPEPEYRSQFEREFLALPAELQYFYATHRDCWGDFAEEFSEGRQLEEMLREWQLFYCQPPAIRAAFLRRPASPDRYSPGALARWLAAGGPSQPPQEPQTRRQDQEPVTATIAPADVPRPAPD